MPRSSSTPTSLLVVGTFNIDVVCRVSALPEPGQTIIASSIRTEFGGKGANQAVAAARQGTTTMIVGAVGNDLDGERYLEHLRTANVRVDSVAKIQGKTTGTAHVYVDAVGENSIVVIPGANECLDPEMVGEALARYQDEAAVFMTQLETSSCAVIETLKVAEANGLRCILNASPVDRSFEWGRHAIDTVIVNEHECNAWFDRPPAELWRMDAEDIRKILKIFRIHHLVVTQGRQPTLHFSRNGVREAIPAWPVEPVDTVGAGDTFAGALAAALCENSDDWNTMINRANMAAALSTLGIGAQTAMPTRSAVERLMQKGVAELSLDPT